MTLNNLIFLPLKKEVLEKKNYLLQSLALHLFIIMLIYYGLPNLFRYRSEFLPPLPVEIINIADKTVAPKINFKKTPDAGKNKTNYSINNDVYYQLKKLGIKNLDIINKNTFDPKNNFFSSRLSIHNKENDYGRNISIIMIK